MLSFYVCLSLGDTIAMDVATVHHGNQFLKYCISLLGYGYYGDVISDSERKRWMGPSRYQFEGMGLCAVLIWYCFVCVCTSR